MNKSVLLLSLLTAAIGAALMWVRQERLEARISGGPKIGILVAANDIPMGTRLTSQMLAMRMLPQSYLEERHIRAADAKKILGIRVRTRLRGNEAIQWPDLATSTGDARTLSSLVPPGSRAIAIPASLSSSFEGLLQPGDRVDVLLTSEREDGKDRATVSLLQNILVLALGEDLGGQEGSEDRRATVTLGVSIPQAQVLALSGSTGQLSLTLRHPDDVVVVQDLPETALSQVMKPEQRARLLGPRRTTGPQRIDAR